MSTETTNDCEKQLTIQESPEKKFESVGPFGRFIEDLKLFVSLMRDYINGSYRHVPWWVIAAAAGIIIYIANPLDLIPDPIPILGGMDDLVIMGGCLLACEQELHVYKRWKTNNS